LDRKATEPLGKSTTLQMELKTPPEAGFLYKVAVKIPNN
jgi:hypothetical protein